MELTRANITTLWRNGSASDSRSEGCVFESRKGQTLIFGINSLNRTIANTIARILINNHFAKTKERKTDKQTKKDYKMLSINS